MKSWHVFQVAAPLWACAGCLALVAGTLADMLILTAICGGMFVAFVVLAGVSMAAAADGRSKEEGGE